MPSTGIPRSKRAGSQCGAPGAYTLAGPPEKIRPSGCNSATRAAGKSWRTIWQKTFCSRTRRAMSWTYCAPKSKIRMRSLSGSGVMVLYDPSCYRFCIRKLAEQFFKSGLVVDFAITLETLDIYAAVVQEIHLPALAWHIDMNRNRVLTVAVEREMDLCIL